MSVDAQEPGVAQLHPYERLIAGVVGMGLLGLALAVAVAPPQRRVALAQCPNAAAGCVVTVDDDLQVFAAAIAALGAVLVLIALLNVRFNQVKVGSAELGYEQSTAGLPDVGPASEVSAEPSAATTDEPSPSAAGGSSSTAPIEVQVHSGFGERTGIAPIAVTRLETRMYDLDPGVLRDYQSARKVSQHSHFLTHILGPATRPGQRYSVAIRVTPHKGAPTQVRSAAFYLGRSWGNRVFEGRRGPDGRFGITTEAYGPFLALCEVEFDDGDRVLLDHYCDFDMGVLLPS